MAATGPTGNFCDGSIPTNFRIVIDYTCKKNHASMYDSTIGPYYAPIAWTNEGRYILA